MVGPVEWLAPPFRRFGAVECAGFQGYRNDEQSPDKHPSGLVERTHDQHNRTPDKSI